MVKAMSTPPVVAREFYQRPTDLVARELLGKLLVRKQGAQTTIVRINEVEAYLGIDDPACHTHGGRRTPRTETMWGPAGRAYVYLVYGLHHCLNVVTVGDGVPEAVLIRGADVVQGLEGVRNRRGLKVPAGSLTNGPGKICQALGVTRAENGLDLCSRRSGLTIRDDGFAPVESGILRLPRVGVEYAGDAASWLLRYVSSSSV
jgi:DNA-3-methyladenine glycosylase